MQNIQLTNIQLANMLANVKAASASYYVNALRNNTINTQHEWNNLGMLFATCRYLGHGTFTLAIATCKARALQS